MAHRPRPADLRERIQQRLLRELAAGALGEPGALLPAEAVLAQRLQVSRSTVHLALEGLAGSGSIEHLPGRGWCRPRPAPVQLRPLLHLAAGSHGDVLATFRGIERGAAAFGLSAVLARFERRDDWRQLPALREPERYAGVCAFSECGLSPDLAEHLQRVGLPAVGMGCNLHRDYDTVCADFAAMSRLLVQRVHALGHRAIAFVGVANLHHENPAFAARVAGYREAMRELGLQPEVVYLSGDFDAHQRTAEEFRTWLTSCEQAGRRPTCLYVSGPRYVARIAGILQRLGLQVPRDLSMAGFGCSLDVLHGAGGLFERFMRIPEPWEAIGEAAASRLILRLRSRSVLQPTLTLVPSALAEGDSVRQLPIPHPDQESS
jgi:DNA-binding LacI/PurR family transcriptional regulator